MGLIVEARLQGNVRQGAMTLSHPFDRSAEPQPAHVVAQSSAVPASEHAREMDRMYADLPRERRDAQRLVESVVQEVSKGAKPPRLRPSRIRVMEGTDPVAGFRKERQDVERQAFEVEMGAGARPAMLPSRAQHQGQRRSALHPAVVPKASPAERIVIGAAMQLDPKHPGTLRSTSIPVRDPRRLEHDMPRDSLVRFRLHPLPDHTSQHDADVRVVVMVDRLGIPFPVGRLRELESEWDGTGCGGHNRKNDTGNDLVSRIRKISGLAFKRRALYHLANGPISSSAVA